MTSLRREMIAELEATLTRLRNERSCLSSVIRQHVQAVGEINRELLDARKPRAKIIRARD
jgi:hypothetical protein